MELLFNMSVLRRLAHHNERPHKPLERVRWTERIASLYTIGAEVMPSCHSSMEVRHAVRTEGGQSVVMKLRYKQGSFVSAEEEKEWRLNMELMLSLPKSGCIAELYEVLEDHKAYYVVMEKVDGMDLFATLDVERRLPPADVRAVIRQLLQGVADLHGRGMIHKDLKLENVMIDRTPQMRSGSSSDGPEPVSPMVVKLIDFDTVEEWSPSSRSHKQAKHVVGTDQYIAQEAYGGKYSPASDIFAVGVIFYRLLTGRFPFNRRMFDDEAGDNWVGSPKMKVIQERVKHYDINWNLQPFIEDPRACDLCRSMLAAGEEDRPKAGAALQHPWLRCAARPWSPADSVISSGPASSCQSPPPNVSVLSQTAAAGPCRQISTGAAQVQAAKTLCPNSVQKVHSSLSPPPPGAASSAGPRSGTLGHLGSLIVAQPSIGSSSSGLPFCLTRDSSRASSRPVTPGVAH